MNNNVSVYPSWAMCQVTSAYQNVSEQLMLFLDNLHKMNIILYV